MTLLQDHMICFSVWTRDYNRADINLTSAQGALEERRHRVSSSPHHQIWPLTILLTIIDRECKSRGIGHDGMSDLEVFLNLVFNFWLGIICGAKPCHGLALFVNHKLGEVPLDGVHQEASLLVFQIDPKRMGVSSIHIDLAEHVKGDVVLLCGKLLDLFIRARFLSPKLVAGEPKNTQTSSFRVLIVHLYQLPGSIRNTWEFIY